MTFNFGPLTNLSNVQASAKSCPGGGGNTGYFKRGQKQEEETNTKTKDYPADSYDGEIIPDEIQEQSFIEIIKNLFIDFLEAIKNFFSK